MATAKHRAIDQLRRGKMLDRKHEQLGHELEARRDAAGPGLHAPIDDHTRDGPLGLMFFPRHPLLSAPDRAGPPPRLLRGVATDEIARAHLLAAAPLAH